MLDAERTMYRRCLCTKCYSITHFKSGEKCTPENRYDPNFTGSMKSCPNGCNWIPFPKSYVNDDGVRVELNSLASKIEKNTIIECLSKLIRKGKGLITFTHNQDSDESLASRVLYTLRHVFPNDKWNDVEHVEKICNHASETMVIFYVQDDYVDEEGVEKVENWAWYQLDREEIEEFLKDPAAWFAFTQGSEIVPNPIKDNNEFFTVPIEFMKLEGPTNVEILTFLKKYEKL